MNAALDGGSHGEHLSALESELLLSSSLGRFMGLCGGVPGTSLQWSEFSSELRGDMVDKLALDEEYMEWLGGQPGLLELWSERLYR